MVQEFLDSPPLSCEHDTFLIHLASRGSHYENLPMQYTDFFLVVKMKIFTAKILIFFLFLLKT